MIFLYRKQASA